MTTTNVPTGKMELTGRAIRRRVHTHYRGPRWSSDKMLFLDDRGFRLWMSTPKALRDLQPRLDESVRFTLTAIVAPSQHDPTFGFASRPSAVTVHPYEEGTS